MVLRKKYKTKRQVNVLFDTVFKIRSALSGIQLFCRQRTFLRSSGNERITLKIMLLRNINVVFFFFKKGRIRQYKLNVSLVYVGCVHISRDLFTLSYMFVLSEEEF